MHLIMNYNLLKMKNFIFTLTAVCVMASLASCQKSDFFRRPGGEGDADCELMVCIGDGFTKVVGQTSAAENKINDVQIFVSIPRQASLMPPLTVEDCLLTEDIQWRKSSTVHEVHVRYGR